MLMRDSGRMLMLLVMSLNVHLTQCLDDAEPVTLTYSVVEEQPAGTELGNILMDAGLIADVNRSLVKQIYFSVLPGKYKLVILCEVRQQSVASIAVVRGVQELQVLHRARIPSKFSQFAGLT